MLGRMKVLRIALLGAVLALGTGWAVPAPGQEGAQPATPTLTAGQPAPDFLLYDQEGKPVRLSGLRGQKVLLVFYKGYY